jgi:hypothetical membrane protein
LPSDLRNSGEKPLALPWKKIGAYCGILAGVLFVIITFIIMAIYPGGYNFLLNYFSELGLTVTGGIPTPQDYVLFSLACTAAAVCSVPFWLTIRTLFTKPPHLKYLGWLGTILGLAAAPFLSGLALFAGDVFPSVHGWSTILFFLLFSSAIVVYSIAIFLNKDYGYLYGLVGVVVAVICYGYILIPFLGGAAMQKLAVYALILWSAFQGIRLLKAFK